MLHASSCSKHHRRGAHSPPLTKTLLARPPPAIPGRGQSGVWPIKESRRRQPCGPSGNAPRCRPQSCPSEHLRGKAKTPPNGKMTFSGGHCELVWRTSEHGPWRLGLWINQDSQELYYSKEATLPFYSIFQSVYNF